MRFIFTRSDSTACRIVRAIDGGEWSHCAVARSPAAGGQAVRCFEAVWPVGVRCRQVSSLIEARKKSVLIVAPLPDEAAAESWLAARLGLKYDWQALPALAIRSAFGAAPFWARDDRWYCAELLLGACAAGGAPIDGPLRRYGVAAAFEHVQRLAGATK